MPIINDNLRKLTIKVDSAGNVTDNILVKYAEQLKLSTVLSNNDFLVYNDTSQSWTNVAPSQVISILGLESGTIGDASQISYSNSVSGLLATNVQEAIDEVKDNIFNAPFNLDGGTAFTVFTVGDMSLDAGGA